MSRPCGILPTSGSTGGWCLPLRPPREPRPRKVTSQDPSQGCLIDPHCERAKERESAPHGGLRSARPAKMDPSTYVSRICLPPSAQTSALSLARDLMRCCNSVLPCTGAACLLGVVRNPDTGPRKQGCVAARCPCASCPDVPLNSSAPKSSTLANRARPTRTKSARSASLGLTAYPQVDMLGVRQKFVEFGVQKSPGSPD